MKTEKLRSASRLANVHRCPGANPLADQQVKKAITHAGYGALPMACRGDLYSALALILKDDPEQFSELVDELRSVLSAADYIDRQAETTRLKSLFDGIKSCPECYERPDYQCQYSNVGEMAVVCFNHPGYVIARTGVTIDEAINSWNDDSWIAPEVTREIFPL